MLQCLPKLFYYFPYRACLFSKGDHFMDNTDCNTGGKKQMPLNSREFIKFCVTSASKLASHDSSGTVKTSYSLPDVTIQEQETKLKTGSSSSGFNIIGIYVYAHKIFLNCETCHTYRVLHKACMYSSKNTYKVNTHVISTHIKI